MKKDSIKHTDIIYIALCFLLLFVYAGYEARKQQSPLSADSLSKQVFSNDNFEHSPQQIIFR